MQRTFPIDTSESDVRFSLDMIEEVAAAMQRHGYPGFADYTPLDVTELHLALFRFLYCGGEH